MQRGPLTDPREPILRSHSLARLVLLGSLALVAGCTDPQPAGLIQPQPVGGAPASTSARAALAPPEARPGPSAAPLGPEAVAAVEAELRAMMAAKGEPAPPLPELPDRPCTASFCVRVVDDVADPLRALASVALPAGARLEEHSVPTGQPGGRRATRMHLVAPASATQPQLDALSKLAAPHLPPKRVLAWGLGEAATGGPAMQSYLLGSAIIDATDVASAERTLFDGGIHAVTVELGADGTKRFADATAKLVHRRLAIVARGRVESAPIVQSSIPGGRLSLSFPNEAEADAFQRLMPPKR